MRVSDLRVGAVNYLVSADMVRGLWIGPDGRTDRFEVGPCESLIPRIDDLRAELRDTMAVSSGRVPRLKKFIDDWGRAFFPDDIVASCGLDKTLR